MNNDDALSELQPLDPAYVTTTRIASAIALLPLIVGAGVIETLGILPPGGALIPTLLIYISIAFVFPARKYRRWGYQMASDRLRIVRGYMFFRDTVVPFGRIQHIDVEQGPIDRKYDLATLTVHTAGNHNNSVTLPGLLHADTLGMRETIRAAIRQDMI